MTMFFVALYLLIFTFPSILIDWLQIRHIRIYSQKTAVILPPKDYITSAKYSLSTLRLSIIHSLFDAVIFACWVLFGFYILQEYFGFYPAHLESIAFVLSFVAVNSVLSLPLKAYQQLVLDKRFGFSTITPKLFVLDTLKGFVLMLFFGFVILWILVSVMSYTHWWLAGFGFVFMVLILLNMFYPTLIAPIFNTFTPLNDENLKTKIQDLMQKAGFHAKGVCVMDASRRDGRLNAYFGGLGSSKRVVLFDTLLEKVSTEGLLAILGHELGHFKHKDILVNLSIMGVLLFVLFFISGHLPESIFSLLRIEKNDATTLIVLLLIAPIVSFWVMPIIGYFSRKAEYRADSYGASLTNPHCLKEALIRLVNENKTFPYAHKIYIFFHYTHPPLLDRLYALKD